MWIHFVLTIDIPRREDEIPNEHVHGGNHAGAVGRHKMRQKSGKRRHHLFIGTPVEAEQAVDEFLEFLRSVSSTKHKQKTRGAPNT